MRDTSCFQIAAVIAVLVLVTAAFPVVPGNAAQQQLDLPSPQHLDVALGQTICRRMSVRAFTDEQISEQQLSTLLWHAYGHMDGQRAIHPVAATYGLHVYVLMENGVYRYEPGNHSLELHRQGDYRWIGQYDTASVKLGIVWDQQRCSSKTAAGANIGQLGQNVYYAANALGLGTVTTAGEVGQLRLVGLPGHE